jgi:hypothetical protein
MGNTTSEMLKLFRIPIVPDPLPPTPKPPGWGDDELTKFWDATRHNQFGTFVNKAPQFRKLSAIDALFHRASKDWLNPASEVSAMLLLRTHSAFRAAAGLAAAGQAVEAYAQNRLVLEFAGVAVHIHRDPPLGIIWLNRHQSEKALEEAINAFSHRKVAKTVTAANLIAGKRFEDLYQRTIDWGGHPNERTVTGNMKMVKEPERRVMLAIMMHGDGPELDMILKTTAQCGLVALDILESVFSARFELLGINADKWQLRAGL